MASPTLAGTPQPASTNTLTQEDIEFAFGPGANLADFTQLTPQEMAETEGDYWVISWRRTIRGIAGFARSLLNGRQFRLGSYAFKFEYHGKPHHYFGRQGWGKLSGWRPHLQLTRYPIKLDPKTMRPLPKRQLEKHGRTVHEYPGLDNVPPKHWYLPWGKKDPTKSIPKWDRSSRTHSLGADATADDFIPRDTLIGLVAREIQIREEWLRGPRSTSEPLYEGPLPSQELRGLIFGIVSPTMTDLCRDYGGRAFGC